MKKALLIAAVTMVSASANASVARQTALGQTSGTALPTVAGEAAVGVINTGAITIADDSQAVFVNPAKMHSFGDVFTMSTMTATTGVHGGVFRGTGDSKFGVYFNRPNQIFTALRNGTGLAEQNAFELFYGMKSGMKWGASLSYSDAQDKDATAAGAGSKTNTMGLKLGAVTDMWEAYAAIGLAGKAEVVGGATTVTSDMALRVGGQYNMDSLAVYADLQTNGAKRSLTTTTDSKVTNQLITLGAESKVKGEGTHFFYGAKILSYTQKVGEGSATATKLPVYAGLEHDAASWLVLRASLSQSVLMNSTKITTNATPSVTSQEHTGHADTALGFGAGLKWGKAIIDGTFQAMTTGTGAFGLDGTNFLANTSLTYNF